MTSQLGMFPTAVVVISTAACSGDSGIDVATGPSAARGAQIAVESPA